MIVSVKRASGAPPAAPVPVFTPHGSPCLYEGELLAPWFIRYRLEEELREARRYGCPLSIVILSPMLLGDDPSSIAKLRAGARAARDAARASDLIGWHGTDDILVVMPHTEADGARAAVERWRADMEAHAMDLGGLKWLISVVADAAQFEDGDTLIVAASAMFRDARDSAAG